MPVAGADHRGILVKFQCKETKVQIIQHNIRTRTPDFFINELLTREVNELYRELRKLKKENRSHIAVLHTNDGIIRAKKSKTGSTHNIFTREDLETFKSVIGLAD